MEAIEPSTLKFAIRSSDTFRSRTYNLGRQVLELVDHLFVRYPVPHFLVSAVLSPSGHDLVFDRPIPNRQRNHRRFVLYRSWFITVAQGGSLARVAKDTFTKREAHWFLQAPESLSIEDAVRWAKARAMGMASDAAMFLVERLLFEEWRSLGDRQADLFRFWAAAWPEMRGYDRDEIIDFVRAMLRDREFSFKGRTYGSMLKLCHEWHRYSYGGTVRTYQTWPERFRPWEHTRKGLRCVAVELTNNRALAEEGKVQRHCVFTYTSRCIQGSSRIVSFRWTHLFDQPIAPITRVTVEINPTRNEVVQIRGWGNRRASDDELWFIRAWAGELGLTIGPWAT